MADDTPNQTQPPSMKGAIMALNPKIVLAFFLVGVAAGLVVFLTMILTGTGTKMEAGTIALLASFVTMFIKMAADGIGYQFNSSAGSDKKDVTQAEVASKLADKVSPPTPQNVAPVAWWGRLKNGEPAAITAAAATDPKVMAFITAANVGAATQDDLTYLVLKGLLTQERATAIQTA